MGLSDGMPGMGLGDLLSMFADTSMLGKNNPCDCDVCSPKKAKNKEPSHRLADASIRGVRANGNAVAKHLYEAVKELDAENRQQKKKIKKLKKQLRKQEEEHRQELVDQGDNFNEMATQSQDEAQKIVQEILRQKAVQFKDLEDRCVVLHSQADVIETVIGGLGKDPLKQDLEEVVAAITQALASVDRSASTEVDEVDDVAPKTDETLAGSEM